MKTQSFNVLQSLNIKTELNYMNENEFPPLQIIKFITLRIDNT